MCGQKPDPYSSLFGSIDVFNALEQDRKHDLTLSQIEQQLHETHKRLVDFLAKAPEIQFKSGTRFQRRLKLDCHGHYSEHAKAIVAWRKGRRI
jgi:hypothetical protein